jgi:hypothetical protein
MIGGRSIAAGSYITATEAANARALWGVTLPSKNKDVVPVVDFNPRHLDPTSHDATGNTPRGNVAPASRTAAMFEQFTGVSESKFAGCAGLARSRHSQVSDSPQRFRHSDSYLYSGAAFS